MTTELTTSNAVNVPLNILLSGSMCPSNPRLATMPAVPNSPIVKAAPAPIRAREEQPSHIGPDDHGMTGDEHREWARQDADRVG